MTDEIDKMVAEDEERHAKLVEWVILNRPRTLGLQNSQWWKIGDCGYGDNLMTAHVFTYDEAREIIDGDYHDKFLAVPRYLALLHSQFTMGEYGRQMLMKHHERDLLVRKDEADERSD
jgi:hypothetical protein